MRGVTALALAVLSTLSTTEALAATETEQLAAQVAEVETAFARTMADRDFAAFERFLSEEAIFVSGSDARRGKAAVADHWQRFFEDATAPFSWAPETVVVLDSGTLALSSGPVWNAEGVRTSTYTSIWRLEAPGEWRIILDRGQKYCE